MFIITYGSPLMLYLGTVVYISMKDISTQHLWSNILDKMITMPCLLPLLINSVTLTSYTIVLLLMRNHLFVWSVFSPKYLYVCAATVCTYVGVFVIAMTAVYTCAVFSFRARRYRDESHWSDYGLLISCFDLIDILSERSSSLFHHCYD